MTTCSACGGAIQVPVCALCLTDRVENWLDNRKFSLAPEFRQKARAYLAKVRQPYNKLNCSECRSQSDYPTCSLCFTEYVTSWLAAKDARLALLFDQEMNASQIIAHDLLLA